MLMSLPFLKSIYLDCQLESFSSFSFLSLLSFSSFSSLSSLLSFSFLSLLFTRFPFHVIFSNKHHPSLPSSSAIFGSFFSFSSLSIFFPVKVHFLHLSTSSFFPSSFFLSYRIFLLFSFLTILFTSLQFFFFFFFFFSLSLSCMILQFRRYSSRSIFTFEIILSFKTFHAFSLSFSLSPSLSLSLSLPFPFSLHSHHSFVLENVCSLM